MLSATGLDELTTQARTNPDLQQALPVLVMLRGLAKPDGDRLMWDIASDGPTVTVNGIDLSQLGGDKSKGKPPNAPVSRKAVERHLPFGAILQFEAGGHAIAGERVEAVARQIGAARDRRATPRPGAPSARSQGMMCAVIGAS